jgi:hypothetical protein
MFLNLGGVLCFLSSKKTYPLVFSNLEQLGRVELHSAQLGRLASNL